MTLNYIQVLFLAMKLTPEEWETMIRKALVEQRQTQNHRIETDAVLGKIRRYISIPILIGAISIYLYYYYFGSQLLFRKILEWTIAGTIFATILAALGRKKN